MPAATDIVVAPTLRARGNFAKVVGEMMVVTNATGVIPRPAPAKHLLAPFAFFAHVRELCMGSI
jgi:hypothetical protein